MTGKKIKTTATLMSNITMEEMNDIFKFIRCKWKIKQWAASVSSNNAIATIILEGHYS